MAKAAKSDKERIESGEWADCWICSAVFRRRRQTLRYCYKCKRGFCEGEHGNFSRNVGTCIVCGVRKEDREAG
jgi:hypothetical protein